MKIKIITDNADFISSISRRITENIQGIEVVRADGSVDLSDGSEACDISHEKDCITVTEKFCTENLPVTNLLAVVEEMYGSLQGKHIVQGRSGPDVWLVRSACGGSGCSSISLTLARILAGKSNGTVVFVSQEDFSGHAPYTEPLHKALRPARELEYLLNAGESINISRYLAEDRYGPLTAGSLTGLRELTDKLSCDDKISHIIVDVGTVNKELMCTGIINVASASDCRSVNFIKEAEEEIKSGSSEFYIYNKASYGKSCESIFYVPDDEQSFRNSDGDVLITMDGSFCAALSTAAEAIINYGKEI